MNSKTVNIISFFHGDLLLCDAHIWDIPMPILCVTPTWRDIIFTLNHLIFVIYIYASTVSFSIGLQGCLMIHSNVITNPCRVPQPRLQLKSMCAKQETGNVEVDLI